MTDSGPTVLDVFGTSRELPANYVIREHVDFKFVDSLTKDRHVIVHGSSKQGKTSLRKKHLLASDYKTITCQRSWKMIDLHDAILKEAGYDLTLSSEVSTNGIQKVHLNAGAGTKQIEDGKTTAVTTKPLEINIGSVTDVIRALQEIRFDKFFVIEEFHYLEESTQVDFAQALKAFHELSKICFIIVGVWLEADKLTSLNNDLDGRITSVNADSWHDEDIDNLFKTSEEMLNLVFAHPFKEEVKKYCRGNVFLVQQICLVACEQQGIHRRQELTVLVASELDVRAEIKDILESQTGRYTKFLMDFSVGFGTTEFELYKWILCPLITFSNGVLANGLTAQALRRFLEKWHPNGNQIKIGRILAALAKVIDLQQEKKISPIIIEYDQTRSRLKIVDKGFLVWREFQEIDDLLSLADLADEYKLSS